MALKPGESFLQGSARVKRQKQGAAVLRSFIPDIAPPPPRVPPVPKAVRDWEKKTPAAKLKAAGFVGAVQTDRAVTRYRYEREAARMAPALAAVPKLGAIRDPALISRQRARSELDRLEHLPTSKRPKDYGKRHLRAQLASEPPRENPLAGIAKGVVGGLTPLAQEYWERATHPSQRKSTLGISSTGLAETLTEGAAKMAAGLPAGVAGMAAHPLRVPGQVKAIVSDIAQPIGLALAASKGSPGSWERLTKQLVQESLDAMEAQYGPEASWSDSLRMSYNQGLIGALQGLAVVAPAARLAAPFAQAGRAAGALGRGLAVGERVPLKEAWSESARPLGPRIVNLRGGEEAMGRPVEIQWSRSPLTRGLVQRPYDVISRRISEETPVVGKLSEAQRAARASRKQLKRDVRRLQADAANQLAAAGRANEAEQLRAFYMRGKPEGVDEDTWLQAQLDDVSEMLAGREFIRAGKPDAKLAQLQAKVATTQKRFERARAKAEGHAVERKLSPLVKEERSLKARLRSAEERNLPTEELTAQLADVQDRLRVARGESVGPLADSPARSQMQAVFTTALGKKQGDLAMQVADQLARGTPDPQGFYDRIVTEYHQNPDMSGIDFAQAFLQEAGPRASLSGRIGITHTQAEDLIRTGAPVTVHDASGETLLGGEVTSIDGGNRRATVRDPYGNEVTVPYEQIGVGAIREPPVFYSSAQKVAAEKLPPKASPEQLLSLMKKNGIKDAELEWTGMGDWIEALQDSGIKSVTREEVIEYLANPLNAYDLNETLWAEESSQYRTRWHSDRYAGVTLQGIPGDYRELMVQLPGERVYASEGHMPGISNPLVQLRFHEVNRQGYNEILIDEMQSDWGAAARDVNYETRTRETAAEIRKLNDRITSRITSLYDTVERELGLHYEAIPEGTNQARYILNGVTKLRAKLDTDWKSEHGYTVRYADPGPGEDAYPAWQEWLASPERKTVERIYKHAEAVARREQVLMDRVGRLSRAPADMPYKKSWELLGLKRMVAYAVHNGYDAISWPQGIVPAVRYHKVDPADELSATGPGTYGEPRDHPQYPDEEDYSRSTTYNEQSFSTGSGFRDDPTQARMFGDIVGWEPQWWQEGGPLPLEGVPMSETRPVSMTAEELGIQPVAKGSIAEAYVPKVDDLFYLEDGPFPDQFVRIARANEDGTFDVAPSGIESIEIRGDGSDSGGGWSEYEATVVDAHGHHYGSGTSAADALRSANFHDVADSEWFDDFETKLDQGWESYLDDDLYNEAVNDFMERWNNGEIEGSEEYAGTYAAEDIASLDVGDYKGNAYRYDTIFPSVARKEWKKYGVEIEKSTVEGAFTQEGRHDPVSDLGGIPTWRMQIPEAMRQDVLNGQSFFQAVYPLSGGTTPVVKGAVELLGNKRFRMSLFGQSDMTTAIHELGHIALYDLDPNDLTTIERELAGSRPLAEWARDDHERFARAWERYFLEGYASRTSLRKAFAKIREWMRRVYEGVKGAGDPISPEVRRVFDKRLGRVGLDEGDPPLHDPALQRWGVLLSAAKTELERYQARAEIARQKGTDEALRAELDDVRERRTKAERQGDVDLFNDLTVEMREITKELDDRDALNLARNERRAKLLTTRADELRKALQKPDSRRYEGAQAAADFFQSEREEVLRDVFGDLYDEMFAGRRQQQSAWLAARGVLPEDMVGEGRGYQPYRRRGGAKAMLREAASPVTRRFGKPRTDKLNLHKRNEMTLWQQGDYQASIDVLHEEYLRALTFAYQHDTRRLLHEIGEPVDVTGPKEGWYLVDPDATPLPREWKGQRPEDIDAELQAVLDGLDGDDSQLALQLQHFAENWLHQDPAKAKRPDGGYGNVRQVHPRIVHQLMLPYTGNQLWNPITRGFSIANTLARTSLIYMSPGYIPSNVLANAIMLFAERGIFTLRDLSIGAKLVLKDRELGRRVRAEMGETMTTSRLRADTGEVLALPRRLEGKLASGLSFVADDWVRAAAWSGVASKHGYRTRTQQLALLDGRTPKTRRDRERVGELATKAMIDFDRLSPWEQRYLRPIVFVWPFMRGSAAWPIEYVKEHPFRAGAAVALTHGYGEQAREEMGPVPDYLPSLVPVDLSGADASIANVQSLSPIGAFGDITMTLGEQVSSAWTGEKIKAFRNLAGFLAPQNDVLLQLVRGQGQFGEALSVQEILKQAAPEMIPAPGLPILLDILDETKPAAQLDQGILATVGRRVFRFTPQRMNLAILNQQAKARGERAVTDKLAETRSKARAAWNQVAPGEHMPRVIEDSIKAYYMVQEGRSLLKDEIKKHQRESWQPTKREPSLTPLQEAAIVYDVLIAQHPDLSNLEDPRTIYDQYGEEGVKVYKRNLERALFKGKRKADEAIKRAKQLQKAGR